MLRLFGVFDQPFRYPNLRLDVVLAAATAHDLFLKIVVFAVVFLVRLGIALVKIMFIDEIIQRCLRAYKL